MFNLNYEMLSQEHESVLKYCLKYSDYFSVITTLKKPFSKIPPNLEHHIFLNQWEHCLTEQIIGVKKWPGTETRDNHKVMNKYNSRSFRLSITDFPNFFLPKENRLPEDICFYRDGRPWLVTISHEKIAFITYGSEQECSFFKKFLVEN